MLIQNPAIAGLGKFGLTGVFFLCRLSPQGVIFHREIESVMDRNLIRNGGVAHDYARTSPMLADLLSEVGIRSEIREDFEVVEDGTLLNFDMLTLNCVRWTCRQPQVRPEWREEWEGKRHAMLWVRKYGQARICYNALGHGPEAFEHPVNRVLLHRGAGWVMKRHVRSCEE